MKILAIETSCDETGIALIETDQKNRIKILANLVSSQIAAHAPFGGVVPNIAKREHQKALPILFKKLQKTCGEPKTLNLIAVTQGPGLAPALWTGVNFAKELAQKLNVPLIGINHLKGHIYLALLKPRKSKIQNPNSKQIPILRQGYGGQANSKFQNLNVLKFPVLTLIVSGGHTELVFSKKVGHYRIIGETQDDAAGEAFDKVARILGLKYPGGPEISKLAERGNPKRFNLPRPMIHSKNYDFSFSGLKTAALYLVRGIHPKSEPFRMTSKNIADLCASFQQAAVDVLVSKTVRAIAELKPKTVILGGGVAANKKLRQEIKRIAARKFKNCKLILPDPKFTTDNALMIALAACAEIRGKRGRTEKILKPLKNPQNMKAEPNLRIDDVCAPRSNMLE